MLAMEDVVRDMLTEIAAPRSGYRGGRLPPFPGVLQRQHQRGWHYGRPLFVRWKQALGALIKGMWVTSRRSPAQGRLSQSLDGFSVLRRQRVNLRK